ncbi:hypothetical protein SEA_PHRAPPUCCINO_26 [Mycobacterium phage Phrappuccino]|uniref:Uncharacterized protein n=1 Tax=Mycobacterium phage Phrappuccino TaxID=2591223 RepID=A0A514DDM0_9CAUD|nr:hypothetical protein KHQ87_gp026 [Mycobacterium phage Phrappuccino]QDH91704.1 hypothetical protein SEA_PHRAPPUCCINO_26 [Mycobacterium phage Phrappuccino]QIQ63148.1 hypothetical protein SEA_SETTECANDELA_26 [Mycobacterium phage Settecandela]
MTLIEEEVSRVRNNRLLDVLDGRYLWRQQGTGTLYRRSRDGWEYFRDGKWHPCYHEDGARAVYHLFAGIQGPFIRVAEDLNSRW